MADRPFLFFPEPVVAKKARLSGRGGTYTKPNPEQQRVRLEARFRAITDGFAGAQPTIIGAEPEQVIVLETLTDSVESVAEAASKIPGLEWLADFDAGEADPQGGFTDAEDPARRIPRRLYALFTNQEAMNSLLALWNAWLAEPNKRATNGFGPFKQLFIRLSDIRRWNASDRIAETGILDAWREDIEVKGLQGTSRFEAELWFRGDVAKRTSAANDIQSRVEAAGGRVLSSCSISEIRYHALLVEVQSAYIQDLLSQLNQQQYVQLLMAEGVMFFRPQGQSMFKLSQPEIPQFNLTAKIANAQAAVGQPVAAILDGLPLTNHTALAGRLIVDDPDGHAALYQPSQQMHGTAMASTVVFGDLNGTADACSRPVYVRPILQPDTFRGEEVTPPEQLLVDLVHRAIRRMAEGEEGTPAVAPSVRIVNLSIGDRSRPFDRQLSPLARLIDWLAWKHRLLFIVSIGNCTTPISVNLPLAQWEQLSPDERTVEVLRAMQTDQLRRRPLSPAESINALTVGASHRDECDTFVVGPRVNLVESTKCPSPLMTVASGFRRSIKPEILLPGGRQLYVRPTGDGAPTEFSTSGAASAPGHLAAVPGVAAMEVTRVGYSCGTSNAAALATRYASIALTKLQAQNGSLQLDSHWAVVLKALLVHGANWGEASTLLERAFQLKNADWREAIRIKRQFLGYGEVAPERCLSATDQRATVIGCGNIAAEQGLVFTLPLPPSLSAQTEYRRFTATLAWLSSCNHQHRNYRRAQLYLTVPSDEVGTRTAGIDAMTARRGTVEHRVFEGYQAKAFLDGKAMAIQVNCKADAGKLDGEIPFAVVVSLEVGATSNIAIYNEVEARIRAQVQIAP